MDSSMTNQERADFDNLLILCPTHHEQVDGKNGRTLHTVADLTRIKQQHEDRFRRVITVIAESQDEYVDLTRRNRVTPCTTLARLLPDQDEETAAWNAEVANRFADELRRVTLAARGLLSTVPSRRRYRRCTISYRSVPLFRLRQTFGVAVAVPGRSRSFVDVRGTRRQARVVSVSAESGSSFVARTPTGTPTCLFHRPGTRPHRVHQRVPVCARAPPVRCAPRSSSFGVPR
ncbi:conserved hypothetical protein [Streptomyces pristinaespiralis ATCC 25486]|uniref:HNH endonuclease n=2 Tax=Streptomyces pristinaespiralis TaxID=38300 RepID=D6X8D7_STRE2|nr:conserved hypothetical protein [Streptomyces pristinaespiralis ATCC 25486]